jgi:hypothetical protein
MMSRRLLWGITMFAVISSSSCTKVLLHSKDKEHPAVSQLFNTSVEEGVKVGREALVRLGYKISREDTDPPQILTGWQSAKAASHYIDLFDRKDYGTISAYYRMKLTVEERAGRALISVSTPTRSIISGRLKTSFREERKVLRKIADLIRKEDFDITNVQVEE